MRQPHKPTKPEQEFLASHYFPESKRLAEMVWDGSSYCYRVRNADKTESLADLLLIAGKNTVPPPIRQFLTTGLVHLPSTSASYGTQQDLVLDITRFLHRYNDISSWWEQLAAHYVLMSWVFDRFSAVPYLRMLGTHGTGKTRMLMTLGEIVYKGTIVSGSIGGAGIFRVADKVRGTLCIDESEFQSDAASDITKLLNSRYMRGLATVRCDGDNYSPSSYCNFGPTVFTARGPFEDESLESRCLTLHTVAGPIRPDVPYQLPNEFYREAQELRNKLLRWRFDRFEEIEVDETKMRDLMPRLGQIGSTLFSVSTDEGFRKQLIQFLADSGSEQSSSSDMAATVLAVGKFVNGKAVTLKVSKIAEQLNTMSSDFGLDRVTSKKMGAMLRNVGFKPKRMGSGYQVRVTPIEIAKLKIKYPMEGEI